MRIPHRHYMLSSIFLICFLVTIPNYWTKVANAQGYPNADDKLEHGWLNFGVGTGGMGVAMGSSYSVDTGKGLLSVRYVHTEELIIFYWGTPPEPDKLSDFAVLYGIATTGYGTSVSLGPSLVFSDIENKGKRTSVGLALESQWFLHGNQGVGIGFYLFGNLNRKQSMLGFLLCLQLGKWGYGHARPD